MRKLLLFISAILVLHCVKAQSVSGNWDGALSIQGTELPVVFHIKKDGEDKFVTTFDSPKQQAFNLPCNSTQLKGDSIIIQMKVLGGKFEGLLAADKKTIDGIFSQGALSMPLILKKTSEAVASVELKRPQTPRPPFNYKVEEMVYSNRDGSIQYGATLTSPAGNESGKYPCVLLITGSGQQDRDATIFGHKSFAVIADYLTKQGIAVLRVDDRGIGKTTGNFATSTSADFANDVEAGIDYLKTRKDIDQSNIGLLGHSEGGMIAPMVASKRKDIKFIVLLAGPAVPITELMAQQSIDVMAGAGVANNDLVQYKPLYKDLVSALVNEKDPATGVKNAMAAFNNWQSKTPASVVQNTTGVTDEKSKHDYVNAFAATLQSPWFNYFMKVDPAVYLNKLNCAVLALNGEKDVQVAAGPNLAAIQKIMVEKPVRTFKVQQMPGLNHLFQRCKTCSTGEYGQLEETFAPEALTLIGDWIKTVVTK